MKLMFLDVGSMIISTTIIADVYGKKHVDVSCLQQQKDYGDGSLVSSSSYASTCLFMYENTVSLLSKQ